MFQNFLNILLLILVFSISNLQTTFLWGRENISADSVITTQPFLIPDTISVRDTLEIAPRQSSIDTIITYSSTDSIIYSIANRKMMLYGTSNIKYKLMELKSERIDINWDTALLNAQGIIDTADTTGKKYTGTPVMIDGGEEFRGHELLYNFKTQKGNIKLADTKSDEGIYYGSRVKKMSKDVLFIADGKYTTCEKDQPHFYFLSPKMKLIVRDKVIAEPIYFHIADVPVFALPFGVFPSKGGRRSGFFAPAYGDNATYGRFLKKIGYYWAMSDYTDLALHGDWYTNGSYVVNSEFNYILRYRFKGGVSGSYKRFITSEKTDPNYSIDEGYNLNLRHEQKIDPTLRADVNFSFMSNNNYRLTNSLSEALQQTIYSNATISKSWEGTQNSGSMNISRTQNLTNGRIDELLPAINFNRSTSFPFRRKKVIGDLFWYEQIGYNYQADASNGRAKIPVTVPVVNIETFRRDNRQALKQSSGISISPKFGYISVTPSLSFRDERRQSNNLVPMLNQLDSTLQEINEKDYYFGGFISSGVSANTRLYGIVQPDVLGVTAFRHTVTPNLAFNYSKQMYGKNIAKGQMLASFDVGNQFEMKLKPKAEAQDEQKIQLLNVGANVSYNFSADSLNFSNIGVGYRTSIGELLNFSGTSSFNLYKFDETSNRLVNKFMISEGKFARLENFSLSLSTSLSGDRKQKAGELSVIDTVQQRKSGYQSLHQRDEPDFSIPWRLSFGWNFSESYIPRAKHRSANISTSLDFNLTENWKFRVSGNYDLIRKEISAPSINIDRDLHCWVMNFEWVPMGTYKHYKLEIRVKASQLQDVKITKQRTTY